MVNYPPNQAGSNFNEFWAVALRRYQDDTGHDLSRVSHFSSLLGSSTVEEICTVLQEREESFKAFRAHGEKIRAVLAPVVRLVRLFVDAGGEVASSSVRPPYRFSWSCLIRSRVWYQVGKRFLLLSEFYFRCVLLSRSGFVEATISTI
jgi:hypothetical protein